MHIQNWSNLLRRHLLFSSFSVQGLELVPLVMLRGPWQPSIPSRGAPSGWSAPASQALAPAATSLNATKPGEGSVKASLVTLDGAKSKSTCDFVNWPTFSSHLVSASFEFIFGLRQIRDDETI